MSERIGCDQCGFELFVPITHLSVSTLGLYASDDIFVGRCILMLDDHYEHMHELPADVAAKFMLDMQTAADAISAITDCERINYAILGNTEPHVHAHLIPRYSDDPVITRTPWEHPQYAQRSKLESTQQAQLVAQLQTALNVS